MLSNFTHPVLSIVPGIEYVFKTLPQRMGEGMNE